MPVSMDDYITSQIIASQSWLFRLAYNLTLDWEEAKDLLQETVLKILDNKKRFTQDSNFKGWSSVIMRNIFINQRRHTKKMKNTIKDENSDNQTFIDSAQDKTTDTTPESNLAATEIIDKINCCPNGYCQLFRMFLEGYSYQEIAQKFSLPIGTVKSRIYTARKWLQTILCGYK